MFSSADEVLAYIKDEDVKFVDVRSCDLPGVMQHFTIPVSSSKLKKTNPFAVPGRWRVITHPPTFKSIPSRCALAVAASITPISRICSR